MPTPEVKVLLTYGFDFSEEAFDGKTKKERFVAMYGTLVQSQEKCQKGEHAFREYYVGDHRVEYCACGATR